MSTPTNMTTPASEPTPLAASLAGRLRERYPNLAWATTQAPLDESTTFANLLNVVDKEDAPENQFLRKEFVNFCDVAEKGYIINYNQTQDALHQARAVQATLTDVNQQNERQVAEVARLRDLITIQQNQLTMQQNQLDQYVQTTTKLHQRINELTSSQTTTQPSRPRKVFEDPERFTGNQTDVTQRQKAYEKWRLQVETAYTTQPDYFPTERSKLVFAISFLSGKAYDSISTGLREIINHPDDPQAWEWETLDKLFLSMNQRYVVIDTAATAERKLDNFPQGNREPLAWLAELEETMIQAKCTAAQKVRYLNRLANQKMRNKFAGMDDEIGDSDWDGWRNKFKHYAKNIARQEHIDKLQKTSYYSQPSTQTTPSQPTPDPDTMDLDAARIGRPASITEEERQERINANKCLACGQAGHYARDHRGPNGIPMPPRETPSFRGRSGYNIRGRGGGYDAARGGYDATRGGMRSPTFRGPHQYQYQQAPQYQQTPLFRNHQQLRAIEPGFIIDETNSQYSFDAETESSSLNEAQQSQTSNEQPKGQPLR
jgi:hypothetical protein